MQCVDNTPIQLLLYQASHFKIHMGCYWKPRGWWSVGAEVWAGGDRNLRFRKGTFSGSGVHGTLSPSVAVDVYNKPL